MGVCCLLASFFLLAWMSGVAALHNHSSSCNILQQSHPHQALPKTWHCQTHGSPPHHFIDSLVAQGAALDFGTEADTQCEMVVCAVEAAGCDKPVVRVVGSSRLV